MSTCGNTPHNRTEQSHRAATVKKNKTASACVFIVPLHATCSGRFIAPRSGQAAYHLATSKLLVVVVASFLSSSSRLLCRRRPPFFLSGKPHVWFDFYTIRPFFAQAPGRQLDLCWTFFGRGGPEDEVEVLAG